MRGAHVDPSRACEQKSNELLWGPFNCQSQKSKDGSGDWHSPQGKAQAATFVWKHIYIYIYI